MSENHSPEAGSGQKKSSNKIIGIILIILGAFNLISLPFAPGTDKLILYLVIGLVLAGGGIWFLKKK